MKKMVKSAIPQQTLIRVVNANAILFAVAAVVHRLYQLAPTTQTMVVSSQGYGESI